MEYWIKVLIQYLIIWPLLIQEKQNMATLCVLEKQLLAQAQVPWYAYIVGSRGASQLGGTF